MSATPPRYEAAPPTLGQHTHEVLRGLGIDERELQALARDGVI
jgi:crotonobetainyl-CoA:carnitine CoA-transferase CaiB-like acyl-CoA transferase